MKFSLWDSNPENSICKTLLILVIYEIKKPMS